MKEIKIKKAYVLSTDTGWVDWETGRETGNLDFYTCIYDTEKEADDFIKDHDLNAINPEFCRVLEGYLISDENNKPLSFEVNNKYLGENLADFLEENFD